MRVSELMEALSQGAADEALAFTGCDRDRAAGRCAALCRGFIERFGDLPDAGIFTAPGCTELGGSHTGHQGGRVLAAAVNLDTAAVAAPLLENEVRVCSAGSGESGLVLSSPDPREEERGTTAALIRGVCAQFGAMGLSDVGFAAVADLQVAPGSGLSSSASFGVMTAEILNGLFCGDELDDSTLALFGQRAENLYFGKPGGLMEQLAGSMGGTVAMDFADAGNPLTERIDYDFSSCGHALVMIDSRADCAGLTEDCALIPMEMRAVACEMGQEVLSGCGPLELYATAPILRDRQRA